MKDCSSVLLRVLTAEPRCLLEIVERTRRLFDLEADPRAVAELFERDLKLGPLIR